MRNSFSIEKVYYLIKTNTCMKKSKLDWILFFIFLTLALAINAYIIYHACLNGAKSSEASQGVVQVSEDVINTIKPDTINETNHESFASFIRKAFGHFGLFVISGLFTSLAIYFFIKDFRWYRFYFGIAISFTFGFLVALTTEIIQLNVPERSGEFTDVLIDSSGYLLGLGIIVLILFLVLRHKKKQSA